MMSAPISQSALSISWCARHCRNIEPNTPEMLSLRAPGWQKRATPVVSLQEALNTALEHRRATHQPDQDLIGPARALLNPAPPDVSCHSRWAGTSNSRP